MLAQTEILLTIWRLLFVVLFNRQFWNKLNCLYNMNILINASNLKAGGGLQVADSICKSLNQFPQHKFVVVLSSFFPSTGKEIENYDNVEVYVYNVKNNLQTLIFGRD